jgi:hypothetical protein
METLYEKNGDALRNHQEKMVTLYVIIKWTK